MAGVLDLYNFVQQQGQIGKQQGEQSRLARLGGQAYSAPRDQRQQYLGQMAQTSPQAAFDANKHFEGMDDNARQKLGQYAAVFDTLPDEQKAQAYPQLAQQAQALGIPAPPQWSPEFAPHIQRIAQTFGGGGTGANVQSRFVDAQGNVMVVMRDGTVRPLGVQAENRFQMRDQPGLPLGAFNTRSGSIQAVPEVGAQQAPQQQMAPGEVPFSIDPSLPPEVQASIRSNPQQWAQAQDGAQMQMPQQGAPMGAAAPRPLADRTPPGYRTLPDGSMAPIPGGPAQIAIDARADAAAAKKAAEDIKASQKQQAAASRQAEASNAANQLVSAIDSLTQSPGFNDLGTAWGDVQLKTPLVRSAVKDAHAQLKNVAGQVALTTMARLKALSSAGATGFGSLTAPELKLLENSIATLQSEDISNAQLQASLKIIRDTMDKTTSWKAPATAAPQNDDDALIGKYLTP